jgi:hypothetical protein
MNNHFEMADQEIMHVMCWRGSRPFVWPLFLFLISDHDASGSGTTFRTEQVALAVYKYTLVIKKITFLYKIATRFDKI